jgi:hypothetical protein
MPKRKPGTALRPKISLEGIQLCELNAERLLKDSTSVSDPTATALSELAVEEACKGLMMYFLLETDTTNSEGGLELEPKEIAELEAFAEKNRRYIEKLPSQLGEAFSHHPVKLRFLRFALRYDKLCVPLLRKKNRLRTWVSQISNPVFRPEEISTSRIDELEDLLNHIRINRLGHLGDIKNESLYVNLAQDGSLVAPGSGVTNTAAVRQLAWVTLAGLKMAIAARSR